MSNDSLNRVREDMHTIRHAIGCDLPFGRADVHASLWLVPCGLLTFLCAWLAPWEYWRLVFIPLALTIAGWWWCAYAAHRDRGQRPSVWREQKLTMLGAPILLLIVTAYMLWERYLGMPRQLVGAAAVFAVGTGMLLVSLCDRRRRYWLGSALPLMAYGVAIPLLRPSEVIMAAGIVLAAAGLATAMIQIRQLRNQVVPE